MQQTTQDMERVQAHFEMCYIARKRYHDGKGTRMEEMYRIAESKLITYLEAVEVQTPKEKEAEEEQLQYLTMQNATLEELVKTQ